MSVPDAPFATAIIVGAGRGIRFGAADKVLLPLAGRPVVSWSLDAAERCPAIHAIVLVVGEHILDQTVALTAGDTWSKLSAIVTGGARRQDSVVAGLKFVAPQSILVAVHDAARPFAHAFFTPCLAAAAAQGAAITAIPVVDTLKRVEDGTVRGTVPRTGLWAAQTPQVFRYDLLCQAFAHAGLNDLEVTDEAALFEAIGVDVAVVPGAKTNLKLTSPDDLALAHGLLASGAINLGFTG